MEHNQYYKNQSEIECSITLDTIRQKVFDEKQRLSNIQAQIIHEKIGNFSYSILAIAIILSLYIISQNPLTFMILWISASLYFYLLYPMLPLFLFPFHYYTSKRKVATNKKTPTISLNGDSKTAENSQFQGLNTTEVIDWARRIHIFKNRRIGIKLVIRFFLFSLLPLTAGIILIYCSSLFFSLILGYHHQLPGKTAALIIIQCLGILFFYLEVFFLRHHLYAYAQSLFMHRKKPSSEPSVKQDIKTYILKKNREILIIALIGTIFLILASIVVIILLVAILLPGITLGVYVNVTEFIQIRTNYGIIYLIICQFIFMQYLQSILSRKIAYDLCEDLILRLNREEKLLQKFTPIKKMEISKETTTDSSMMKKALSLLTETNLHAINRRQMFGLFPIYSIGVEITTLLSLQNLDELSDIVSIPD